MRRSRLSRTAVLMGIIAVAWASRAHSQLEVSGLPSLSGGASAPIAVRSGEVFSFQVTGQDHDFDAQRRLVPDRLYLGPGDTPAIQPGSMVVRERRLLDQKGQPTGEVTWTVTGKAVRVTESEVLPVTFLLWDGRSITDPRADAPLAGFSQTITVSP